MKRAFFKQGRFANQEIGLTVSKFGQTGRFRNFSSKKANKIIFASFIGLLFLLITALPGKSTTFKCLDIQDSAELYYKGTMSCYSNGEKVGTRVCCVCDGTETCSSTQCVVGTSGTLCDYLHPDKVEN